MLAILIALAAPIRTAAQTANPPIRPSARLTVDTIIIQNQNVFDRDDDAPDWVARVANRLHVRTRQWVIRRRLLLDRGDPFDVARMQESERALRTLGVFRSVRVDTVRTADGRFGLHVVTADGWSTQPQASFTSAGGDKTWAAGFVERNFLGTGTQLAMIYGKNPDRSQLDFEFLNPNFIGRRTLLLTRYSDLSDGNRGEWQFGLPFYETAARYSLQTYGSVARERVLRFRDDTLQDSTSHHLFRLGLTGGIAVHSTTRQYARLWAGWEWRREDFTPTDTARVPYSVFTTVRAGVDLGVVRFRVLDHFNSYARREDVDLSPMLHLGIVMQSGLGYEFSGQASIVWQRGFALIRADANGFDTTRTRGQVTIVSQNIPRHTLIAHAEGAVVTNPQPGHEFDPWIEQREPRLFGLHDFSGTRTTWFVLEDRILVVDDVLGMMAMGAAPFVEYGGAWWSDEPVRQGGDVGLALRFGPTRAVRGDAAELAFGYRWGPGIGRKPWAFTLRKGFSF